MKLNLTFSCLAVGLTAWLNAPAVSAKPVTVRAIAPPAGAAKAVAAEEEIPQSVFTIPSSPRQGRNPFFPRSSVSPVQIAKIVPGKGLDSSVFVLNGITSPPKRTAMINARTFEPGEQGEVKLSNGAKVMIKCLEIREDSAIISVAGERRELRLRSSF